MAIKTYKPTTAGRRFMVSIFHKETVGRRPLKRMRRILHKKSGRSHGKITVRHQGGQEKRFYRPIDFKRDKYEVWGTVSALEYDPNRSSLIALIHYQDGEKRYILAPRDIKAGDRIISSENADIKIGNALSLLKIPLGTLIHNIALTSSGTGQIVRSAGSVATLMAKDEKYAHVKLPSGEIRLIPLGSHATIGQVSNPEHSAIKFGKAGRKRHFGIRSGVRGVAMPAGVHPHGGGEGRTGPGRPTKTIYGKPARGNTRTKNKKTNILIVQSRKSAN